MRWEAINNSCIFAYSPEAEPLHGVLSLMYGESRHQFCTALYGADQIAAWKRGYRFLFETFDAMKHLAGYSLLDFLLDTLGPDFTRETCRDFVLSLPEAERVYRLLPWEYLCKASKEDVAKALEDDAVLGTLYAHIEDKCPSFLGFTSFVRQSSRYYEEFFALAAEMDTPALRDALQAHSSDIEAFRARVLDTLRVSDGLEASQQLMGKSFYNRGPYEQFIFMPSLLVPFNALRYFYDNNTPHNRQVLICSIREQQKQREDTVAALKVLSDETRYQILMFLADKGPAKGQDIARMLKLTPSTVSHHMAELRQRGLVTEEPVRTAKYYGISGKAIRELLSAISKDLKLDSVN